jgi:hypothetical protein
MSLGGRHPSFPSSRSTLKKRLNCKIAYGRAESSKRFGQLDIELPGV